MRLLIRNERGALVRAGRLGLTLGAAGVAASLPAPADAQLGPSFLSDPVPGVGSAARPDYSGTTVRPGPWYSPFYDTFRTRGQDQAGPRPPWLISPRIDIAEAFNDNIFQTPNGRVADAVTYIQPSVLVLGDSSRVRVNAFYGPVAQIYAGHLDQSTLGHNLNAGGLVTILEDALFLDFRAYAQYGQTNGGIADANFNGFGGSAFSSGFGAGTGSSINGRNNDTQSFSYAISPYFVHRFGGFGDFKLGYSFRQSYQDSRTNTGSNQLSFGTGNSNLTTNQGVALFTTGDDFGRIKNITLATTSQSDGNGVVNNSSQTFFINQLGYALTRTVTVFGDIGYENIRYSGFPPTRISDVVWAVGTRLTPDPDSTIVAGYGHRYGFNSVFFNGNYNITARTSVYARYSESLGTDLQQLQDDVSLTSVDDYGGSVDSLTRSPFTYVGNYIGNQGNSTLSRTKTFTAGAITRLDRDSIALSVIATESKLVATAVPGFGYSSRAISGVVTWEHQLTPDTTGTASATYGSQRIGNPSATENVFGASVGVRHALSETLTTFARYILFDRSSQIPGRSYLQNVALVGIGKEF